MRRLFLAATGALVVAAVGGAFSVIGSPAHQRNLRIDDVTITALQDTAFAQRHTAYHPRLGSTPLAHAESLYGTETGAEPIAYHRVGQYEFELCTTFREGSPPNSWRPAFAHSAGPACYRFDARTNAYEPSQIEPIPRSHWSR